MQRDGAGVVALVAHGLAQGVEHGGLAIELPELSEEA